MNAERWHLLVSSYPRKLLSPVLHRDWPCTDEPASHNNFRQGTSQQVNILMRARNSATIVQTEQEVLRLLKYDLKASEWLNRVENWSWFLPKKGRQQAEETKASEAHLAYPYSLVRDLESEISELEKIFSVDKRVLKRKQRILDAIDMAKPQLYGSRLARLNMVEERARHISFARGSGGQGTSVSRNGMSLLQHGRNNAGSEHILRRSYRLRELQDYALSRV
ncbi:hypothetical protein PENANT_c056G06588 [Penicillium antarcticum]|uniref:Uncharacterized protein n=1 Tax=Penicillium antarcticum TaxID=416450 RepID=A0A1V6PQE6_9EURO|nr:hypothetical protein PENANT_c056G06588 [Penicillium antarcticum]